MFVIIDIKQIFSKSMINRVPRTFLFALVSTAKISTAFGAINYAESTAFPGERHMIYRAAFIHECESLGFPQNPRITTQGRQGIATAGVENLPSGNCDGQGFPYATAHYTWTGASDALQDSVVLTTDWPEPIPGPYPVTLVIKRAAVKISNVDLGSGSMTLDINGSESDSFGMITLDFANDKGEVSSQLVDQVYKPAASISIQIDRSKIPAGAYVSLTAKWKVTTYRGTGELQSHTIYDTYSPPIAWKVLGVVQYTQYNSPQESARTGPSSSYYLVDSQTSCKFSVTTLVDSFAKQTATNGTGNSLANGLLKIGFATNIGKVCAGKFPADANLENSFPMVRAVVGACLDPLISDSSVATFEPSARGNCGALYTLVTGSTNINFGSRQRQDLCPACRGPYKSGIANHFDNYSAKPNCDARSVGDLGNFYTLQN